MCKSWPIKENIRIFPAFILSHKKIICSFSWITKRKWLEVYNFCVTLVVTHGSNSLTQWLVKGYWSKPLTSIIGWWSKLDLEIALPISSLSTCWVQIIVWKYLQRTRRTEVLATKMALLRIVILQYFARFLRFLPLASEVKKTAGVFSENALVGAMYYLIWYMLASHVSALCKMILLL